MADHDTHDHTGIPGVSSGSVATDTIWDAAGDTVVGTGANTAARLAKGNAGGALSIINAAVAWNSGTSFPGSAATGDRYWRTDVNGGMEYVFDGTRWVSSTIFHDIGHNDFAGAASANATAGRWAFPGGTYTDIWMIAVEIMAYHSSTTPATIYWNFDALKGTAAESEASLGTSNTQNNTSQNWTAENITVGALLGAYNHIRVSCTKTSTPGNLNIEVAYRYRLVQT